MTKRFPGAGLLPSIVFCVWVFDATPFSLNSGEFVKFRPHESVGSVPRVSACPSYQQYATSQHLGPNCFLNHVPIPSTVQQAVVGTRMLDEACVCMCVLFCSCRTCIVPVSTPSGPMHFRRHPFLQMCVSFLRVSVFPVLKRAPQEKHTFAGQL